MSEFFKKIWVVLLFAIAFAGVLYSWILPIVSQYIATINSTFYPYVDRKIVLWFFLVILGLAIWLARSFSE
jgi:hypothetical protein